jgi:hypothetical protein
MNHAAALNYVFSQPHWEPTHLNVWDPPAHSLRTDVVDNYNRDEAHRHHED